MFALYMCMWIFFIFISPMQNTGWGELIGLLFIRFISALFFVTLAWAFFLCWDSGKWYYRVAIIICLTFLFLVNSPASFSGGLIYSVLAAPLTFVEFFVGGLEEPAALVSYIAGVRTPVIELEAFLLRYEYSKWGLHTRFFGAFFSSLFFIVVLLGLRYVYKRWGRGILD